MVSLVSATIYVLVHLATYYLFVHVLGKGHIKHKNNKELLDKYEPFHRIDVNNWSVIKQLPMILLFWPKMAFALCNLVIYPSCVVLLMIGKNDVS
jgi:hypothetical protein